MNDQPEQKLDLDLHFLPAWAQQSPAANRFADYEGETESREPGRGPKDRRDRPSRRDRQRERERKPPAGGQAPQPKGKSRTEAERGRRDRPRHGRDESRPAAPPLPNLNVTILPEEKGVESLAKQIKLTGRAYALFDIAKLVLQKPDRYSVMLSVVKDANGQVVQPLVLCTLDNTLWLSLDEAVAHVLAKHFAKYYQEERVPAEPPKGTYTCVAQCGLSGVILGPPNYHDFQNKLRKLHAERFARMPFETYRQRVKIVRDEAVVKQWLEEQSFKSQYVCLNVPEPAKLASREEVERHFRQVHAPDLLRSVERHTLGGAAALSLPHPQLRQLVRRTIEDQQRFPLKVVTVLSQQFAAHGLQFFKVNKTVTHVAVARPHYLDLETTPVSEGCRRIIEFINAHPGCSPRELVEGLAPSPPLPTQADSTAVAPAATAAAPGAAPAGAAQHPPPTEAQAAVIADLHWLVHQGHVIEFANGRLETAKPPSAKVPKPAPATAPPTAADAPEPPPATEPAPVPEAAPAPHTQAASGAAPAVGNQAGPELRPAGESAPAPQAEEAADSANPLR
jgi:hypothetical protein